MSVREACTLSRKQVPRTQFGLDWRQVTKNNDTFGPLPGFSCCKFDLNFRILINKATLRPRPLQALLGINMRYCVGRIDDPLDFLPFCHLLGPHIQQDPDDDEMVGNTTTVQTLQERG